MDKTTARAIALAQRDSIAPDRHASKCAAICASLIGMLDDMIETRFNATPDPHVCFSQAPLCIGLYQAMRSEVSIARFIEAVYDRGMTACFPCMVRTREAEAARPSTGLHAADAEAARPPAGSHAAGSEAGPRAHMVFRAVSREQYERGGVPFLDRPVASFEPDDPQLAPYPLVDVPYLDMVVVPLVAFDESSNRLGYGGGNYDRLLPSLRDDAIAVGVAFEEQRLDAVPCDLHDCRLPAIATA